MYLSRFSFPPAAAVLLCVIVLAGVAPAREISVTCGSHPDRWQEEYALHERALERRRLAEASGTQALAATLEHRSATSLAGDVVLMEDGDGVVSRRNAFDLDGLTVSFQPTAAAADAYQFSVDSASYDDAAASSGDLLEGFGDDDSREVAIPFAFPFFSQTYTAVYISSDGNLTFGESDVDSGPRSLDRVVSGPPRIAPLFRDLDPTLAIVGVSVLAEASRFVVSWVSVPEYSSYGTGARQTFQVRLYPDGTIDFAYNGISTSNAIVAISPGDVQGSTRVVSFSGGSNEEFSGTIAERFTLTIEVDIFTAAQKFYEEYDDAYDFLVFYNNLDIAADLSTVAYEITIRNRATGIGDPMVDFGRYVGSPNRLQSVLNMGPLSQYPEDPTALVPARATAGDTPLSVLGHEAGHLFLAFASVRDSYDEDARPMLGRDGSHWSFVFNSEASLLEGNRICDRVYTPNLCPADTLFRRFVTIATVEGYSPLDEYLMGFRAPQDVPDMFVVENSGVYVSRSPQVGYNFDGDRRDIRIDEVIEAEGRRTPDHTVSQRRFRFAIVLVHATGEAPSAADIEQVDLYRQEFETYFNEAADGQAFAETSILKRLGLSTYPAAGLLPGGAGQATVSISSPEEVDLTVLLTSDNGGVTIPASVTIPAGDTGAVFDITAMRAGVDEITADIPGGLYEQARSRIHVAEAASGVEFSIVSGDKQPATPGEPLDEPVVVQITDINRLPYPGVQVTAVSSPGGVVNPAVAVTDSDGLAAFTWTPAAASGNQLELTVPASGGTLSVTALTTGQPSFPAAGVVEAAAFVSRLSPGTLATIFGVNLAAGATAAATLPIPTELEGVSVLLNGEPTQLLYVSDPQINFTVPLDTPAGQATLTVVTPLGSSADVAVDISAVSPGIFVMTETGTGAVTIAGTGLLTTELPAAPGDYVEIYSTGLGAVEPYSGDPSLSSTVLTPAVTVDGVPATIQFSGLTPGIIGLYQVNVEIPGGVRSGARELTLSIGGVEANAVTVVLE